jgi:hypothetical protein
MAETLLSARTEMRILMVDTDTTDPALANSECNTLIGGAYLDYSRQFPEQFSASSTASLATIDLANGVFLYDVPVGAGIIEFTNAVGVNSSAAEQNALERADFSELYRIAKSEANTTTGYPSRWGVRRITNTSCQFVVYPAPIAPISGKLVYVWGYKEPTPPTSDSGSFTAISDAEVRWIARLAAIRGASVIGRDQGFIDRLWSDLPQKMQSSMRKVDSFKRPYANKSEVTT